MEGTHAFEQWLWGVTLFLKAGLVLLVVYRKNNRVLPFFFSYLVLNFLQSVLLYETYRIWGLDSPVSLRVAWGTQGLVTLARALAVAEICHAILARHPGIWQLAWRLLAGTAIFVTVYSWAVSRGRWELVILSLDRALEMAMVSAIAILFVFARHYQVTVTPVIRLLSIGFFQYSCFRVINDTILERWLHHYASLWNLLDVLAFLGSLLLWMWALRQTLPATARAPELLPENDYRVLSPAINARLKALNEQLIHFWRTEGENT